MGEAIGFYGVQAFVFLALVYWAAKAIMRLAGAGSSLQTLNEAPSLSDVEPRTASVCAEKEAPDARLQSVGPVARFWRDEGSGIARSQNEAAGAGLSFQAPAILSNADARTIRDTVCAKREAPNARLQTPLERPGKRHNYFARHWQGELPLWISYWLTGFILTVAVAVVVIVVTNSIKLNDDFNPDVALLIAGMWIASFFIFGWQSVGIWRSAKRYKQTEAFWGSLAQLAVILGIFRAVIDFGTHGLPQINELFSIYLGDQRLGTYAVRMQQGGRVLEFSGGITFGAAQEFGRFLDSMSEVKEVRLESNGGRISEAQRIGTLIRSRGLNTYVSDHCFSACTHIFLSGRDRVVGPGGKLGFHQPDFPGLSSEQRRLIVEEEGKSSV